MRETETPACIDEGRQLVKKPWSTPRVIEGEISETELNFGAVPDATISSTLAS